jgi:predicted DNA binding CopG/RHH family protein
MSPAKKQDQKSKHDQSNDDFVSPVEDEKAIKRFEAELAAAHEQEERRRKIPKSALAKGRTTPIAVRFDEFTLKRLRVLAARRNTGYQTLLKEFVVERLYEEEKRDGIIE